MITMPREFRMFCWTLQLENFKPITTVDNFVEVAVRGIQLEWVPVIVTFLDEILSRNQPSELLDWWWSTPSAVSFHDAEGFRNFLTLLRERLARPPFSN